MKQVKQFFVENEKMIKVGKRGIIVIPVQIRKHFKLKEGSLLIIEEKRGGIFLRPAEVVPSEIDSIE